MGDNYKFSWTTLCAVVACVLVFVGICYIAWEITTYMIKARSDRNTEMDWCHTNGYDASGSINDMGTCIVKNCITNVAGIENCNSKTIQIPVKNK